MFCLVYGTFTVQENQFIQEYVKQKRALNIFIELKKYSDWKENKTSAIFIGKFLFLNVFKKDIPQHTFIEEEGLNISWVTSIQDMLNFPDKYMDFDKNITKLYNMTEDYKEKYCRNFVTDYRVLPINTIIEELYEFSTNGEIEVVVDIETTSLNPRTCRIEMIGLSILEMHYIISEKDIYDNIKSMKLLFETNKLKFIWQNGQFDVKCLRFLGINARIDEDTLLQSYSMDERQGIHGLEYQSCNLLNIEKYKEKHWKVKENEHRPSLFSKNKDLTKDYEYLVKDLNYTSRIYRINKSRMNENEKKVYYNILIPASNMLADVESNGICINKNYAKELKENYTKKIELIQKDLQTLANDYGFNEVFNPASPKQLGFVLRDLLGLPEIKSTSTDAEVLFKYTVMLDFPYVDVTKAELKDVYTTDENIVIDWISNATSLKDKHVRMFIYSIVLFRMLNKMLTTYIEGVLNKNEQGRIYSHFYLFGTVTGRLSSADPFNMQNIPRNKQIKNLFTSKDGYTLVTCDYSQAELRVLAIESNDKLMWKNYLAKEDLHTNVAKSIYGDNYTKEQRVKAKTLNFGIAYGAQASNVSKQLKITLKEAQKLIDDWHKNLPEATIWLNGQRDKVIKGLPIVSMLGREKRIGLITKETLNGIQNEAMNTPIQATASDMTLLSAVEFNNWIKENKYQDIIKIVNIIHDDILIECRDDCVMFASDKLKTIMESVPKKWLHTDLPFEADPEITNNGWGSKKPLIKEE